MVNWMLSLMVIRPQGITEDEADYLAKELPRKTHPTNFKEAHKLIKELLDEFDSKGIAL